MYATYNEGKSVVAERFIRTLKNKIFKRMAAISKNVYGTIRMKPIDVTGDSYVECNEYPNKKDPKFKVGNHVRISKYKNIFAKEYAPNWSEEVFVIDKIKNTVPWTYVISNVNGEEITGSFCEKELQKGFKIEKVLKRKGDKLYVKWKGYDNRFNSWIDKKGLV